MSSRTPMVVASGQLRQAAAGDSLDGTFPTIAHVISADLIIPDGATMIMPRYIEIAAGVTLTIGAGADLEVT